VGGAGQAVTLNAACTGARRKEGSVALHLTCNARDDTCLPAVPGQSDRKKSFAASGRRPPPPAPPALLLLLLRSASQCLCVSMTILSAASALPGVTERSSFLGLPAY
jgi:hypothetical protein